MPKDTNIKYKSKEILEFYSSHRKQWNDFYPSERWVFEKIAKKKNNLGDILDVGCACGGLGVVLDTKFKLRSYTGIDVHEGSIKWARSKIKLKVPSTFIAGDIAYGKKDNNYDTVIALGCADWNIETKKIIDSCWEKVENGGHFVISLRLTPKEGINNIEKSYQLINFSGNAKKPEIANYVVFNVNDAIKTFTCLIPRAESIGAYGYWGKPSQNARTPFDKLIFTVFYIKKGTQKSNKKTSLEINLPKDVSYENN